MILELIICFLVPLTIFLLVRKVILGGKKGVETTKEGKPKETLISRLSLQKWSVGRIATLAFVLFVLFFGFELVVLVFDGPSFSLIRKLEDIARKNDVDFQVKRVTQNKIAAETQKDRKELSNIHDNIEKAKELRQKIKDTEAKHDPTQQPAQPQRRLSSALRGKVYMSDHEGSAQAKIVFLDDVRLVVRYAYHCGIKDYVGKFDGIWSEEEQCYVGQYVDTTEKGTMKFKPFASLSKEIYRFDGQYKKEGGDTWVSVTITHQEGVVGATHNCLTKS